MRRALFVALSTAVSGALAFAVGGHNSCHLRTHDWCREHDVDVPRRQQRTTPILRMVSGQDPTSDLTSTLARLDRQWEIQQRATPTSRWTKLVLPSSEEEKQDPSTRPTSPSPFTAEGVVSEGIPPFPRQDYVYLLEPPNNAIPSCLIVFTGGAGLGTYPQLAYNEFLLRLSNRLNAAVITAPYNVGLDHFALAKETGDLARRAMIYCQDNVQFQYPESLPVYAVTHSLGGKLACIYTAATAQKWDGMGFISFNNFSFGKTIGMAREFAATIRESTGMSGTTTGTGAAGVMTEEALNTIFNFAEMAVSAVGIDFSPTQIDMERLIQMKFTPELQQKTRLFTFDKDKLENSQDFLKACGAATVDSSTGSADQSIWSAGPTVSGLPGTHLTPVFFKLGVDDIPDEYAREMAREATGGFESASFGDEEELATLVDEVSNWILGKPPSRKPAWLRERPQIAAAEDS